MSYETVMTAAKIIATAHLDDKYKNSNNNIAARHMFRISGVETKKYELSERPVTLNL